MVEAHFHDVLSLSLLEFMGASARFPLLYRKSCKDARGFLLNFTEEKLSGRWGKVFLKKSEKNPKKAGRFPENSVQ
jgi:hypothetical protein